MCFILHVYYTQGYVQGALRKTQLLGSFVEHFNESQVKYIFWFSSLILLNLIQNGFLARLACVHDALERVN